MSALQLRGDLWAMHAEQRGSMGQAVAVTDDALTSNSSDAVLISTDSKESGLWLWQGDAPSPPSCPRPKSRDRHILRRIMPAAGWAGWIALPTGLALTLIAILMIPHPDRPVSADRPAVAPSSATSPTVAPSSAPSPALTPSSAHVAAVGSPGRCRTPAGARDGPLGSGESAVRASCPNYDANARTANGEIACTTQIVASCEKNAPITRSQRAVIPDTRSSYTAADDVAW